MKPMQIFAVVLMAMVTLAGGVARAASGAEIDANASQTLATLYNQSASARALGAKARGILIFSKITKAGLMVGGQYGEGALLQGGKAVGYYSTAGASYGLQIGAQQYGYAMFFMNDKALSSLNEDQGFEVGVGPSVVVVDEGMAKSVTTTTMKDDIYGLFSGRRD